MISSRGLAKKEKKNMNLVSDIVILNKLISFIAVQDLHS